MLVSFGFLGWIAIAQLARPLNRMTGAMVKLAGGDLDVTVEGTGRSDEVGALARSLDVFRDQAITARRLEAENRDEQARKERRQQLIEAAIAGFERVIRESLDTLASSARNLHEASQRMSETAEETSRQAATVAGDRRADDGVEAAAAAPQPSQTIVG